MPDTLHLTDLLDLDELEREIAGGYVQRKRHEEFDQLELLGYTPRAQFESRWTRTVMLCRGLIWDRGTGEIVARPFAKFHNYGQADWHQELDLDAPLLGAFDKFDGSLGILYRRPDGAHAIATRGSFHSEQAQHATALLQAQPHEIVPGRTALFEIIYPDNRIVLDYGSEDRLVHLGDVEISSGAYLPPAEFSSFATTLRETLALPPRPNAEGMVVWTDPFTAVKVKQEDYLALHRAVSNLTRKEVWRQLCAGTFAQFAADLPDEFHRQATEYRDEIEQQLEMLEDDVARLLAQLIDAMADPHHATRKEQALWITAHAPATLRGSLFTALDGRDLRPGLLKLVEPSGDAPRIAEFA